MAEEPVLKKAKVDEISEWMGEYEMNLSEVLVKDCEGKSLHEIAEGPLHQLQGITERADEMMEILGVKTVAEFAAWKYAKWASAICTLSTLEREGKRPEGCLMNVDKALDKEYEACSLKEMIALPCSALQGLTAKADELLRSHHVTTIEKLGKWKYILWARAIVDLVDVEETMTPSERTQAKLLKRLE